MNDAVLVAVGRLAAATLAYDAARAEDIAAQDVANKTSEALEAARKERWGAEQSLTCAVMAASRARAYREP